MNRIARVLFLILIFIFATAIFAPPAVAQKTAGPAICPYCKNDPKILERCGIVRHTNMPFGKGTSDDFKKFLTYANPIFIESKHFRIAMTLPDYSIPENDWKRYEAELEKLSKVLPGFRAKEHKLDPWLRIHLLAQRCEDRYERFLKVIQLKDEDFYERTIGKPYRGEGRYLGMRDKFEIVLLRNTREFTDTLRDQSGSTTKLTKREHFVDRGCLSFFIPCEGDLKPDDQLWAHICHNLGHNFILGYKYYSYEPPKWFEEGFAHVMEKEVHDNYNSFDSEESALAEMTHADDWFQETLKIIDRKRAASLADLIHKKSFSEISKEDHVIIWSKVDFMLKVYPAQTAKFLDAVRGRLNDKGFPDGSDLTGIQRNILKEHFKLTFLEFDAAWEKWVRKEYLAKPAR